MEKSLKNLCNKKIVVILFNNLKLLIMKKIFLMGAFALFGAMNAQSTGFKLGAHVGLPTGDANTFYNF